MSRKSGVLGKYEALWLTNRATTRGCVYASGSFAILSLRFFLHPATSTVSPVQMWTRSHRDASFRAADDHLLRICAVIFLCCHPERSERPLQLAGGANAAGGLLTKPRAKCVVDFRASRRIAGDSGRRDARHVDRLHPGHAGRGLHLQRMIRQRMIRPPRRRE